jgi:hypothetical protein
MMMNNVRNGGIGYIPRKQACRKKLLHHEKVG